MMFYLST